MTDMFTGPASPSGIQWADLEGCLLLLKVTDYRTGIVTSLGEKDAVEADVTVLDGTDAGTLHESVLVFPKVLIGQLKPRIGGMVLGRLGKGTAKPGQSAPWLLAEPTDADKKTATAHLNRNAAAPF